MRAGYLRARRRLDRLALEERSQALPDADAHRRDGVVTAAALELAQDRAGEPRARHPDGVADRDRAAVRVGALIRQPQRSDARDHLRGEGFVELDRVALVGRDAGPRAQLCYR